MTKRGHPLLGLRNNRSVITAREKESKGSLVAIFILVEQVRNKLDIYPQAQK